jgi:cell division protein FtsB
MAKTGLKRVLFLLAVLLTIYFVGGLINGYFQNKKVLRRYTEVQKSYENTRKLNEDLKVRLKRIREDDYVELTAREKLGLVKPGETAYKIIKED